MNKIQAIEAVLALKKITHEFWQDGSYVYISQDDYNFYKKVEGVNPVFFDFNNAKLHGWEIYKDKKDINWESSSGLKYETLYQAFKERFKNE